MPTIEVGDMFVAIVAFSLDDPAQQAGLIDGIVAEIDGWVKHIPGFVSASFHASHDGRHVLNYAQWTSRDAYATFGRDDRRQRIQSAVHTAKVTGMETSTFSAARVVTAPTG